MNSLSTSYRDEVYLSVEVFSSNDGNDLSNELLIKALSTWLGYIIIGVAIIVVAVPEGLPLAVMISLAYSI